MVLDILETTGDDDALDALIARAAADMAATGADESGNQTGERFIMVTPARLRPYAERRVLEYLGEHPTGLPGVTLEVHSFTSMARSVIGNRYDGRYAKPVVSPFTLRAFLAARMRHDPQTFRTAGETFGSANQFAAQVTELLNAGVRPHDITGMPDADERMLALAKLLALVEDEFGDFTMPGANASVITPWAEDHGDRLHMYLYGFEQMTPDELRTSVALARHTHCTLSVDCADNPDFVQVLAADEQGTAASTVVVETSLPDVHVPANANAYYATDEIDEVRRVAAEIASLHDEAERAGHAFSYGDVLVTARDLSPYQAALETEFAYRSIPANATPTATMADQPMADLLLGLLDERLYTTVPDTTTLLRVFRSGLLNGRFYCAERDVDRVADALYTNDPITVWLPETRPSQVVDIDDTTADTIRRMREFIEEARPVFASGGVGSDAAPEPRSVRDALSDITRFLVRIGVNRLVSPAPSPAQATQQTQREHNERDRQQRERLFEQSRPIWRIIMGAFDSLVSRFADEPFADSRPTFVSNLETLLREQPMHGKPRATNAVDVVAFPTTMRPYRYVFMLGATESVLPAVPHESGLLDDAERQRLASALDACGKTIEAAALRTLSMQSAARREILAFNRVVRYAGHATFLCPRVCANTSQALSPFVARVLPKLPAGAMNTANGTKQKTRWQTIDDLHLMDVDGSHAVPLRDMPEGPLDRGIMLELFTKPADSKNASSPRVLSMSVSAAEAFYDNPFEVFLNRGLQLQPVEPFQFDPATRGSFYHAVLERLLDVKIAAQQAQRRGDDLSGIPNVYRNGSVLKTDSELIDLFAQLDFVPEPIPGSALPTTSLLQENPAFAILTSDHRMLAVHDQLKNTLRLFLRALGNSIDSWHNDLQLTDASAASETAKKGSKHKSKQPLVQTVDRPLFAEKQFGDIRGQQADWRALESTITGHAPTGPIPVTLRIRGKVDRVDEISRGDHLGSLILDYKSSPRVLFDSKGSGNKVYYGTGVYYGHRLQLLTYALAAAYSSEQLPDIAGMMFLPIKSEATKAVFTELRPLPADAGNAVTGMLARAGLHLPKESKLSLTTAGCLIEPWKPRNTKVGTPQPVLSNDKLTALQEYAQHMIEQACEHMLDGMMPVAPYRTLNNDDSTNSNAHDGMTYSDYPDVMALDLLDGTAWRYERPKTLDQLTAAACNGQLAYAYDLQEEAQ